MDDMLDEAELTSRIAAKQNIKLNYLEKESEKRLQYIKDLEASVLINKQIINDLCVQNKDINKTAKNTIEKLNEENIKLTFQVKSLISAKTEAEAKLLIQAQIINENKTKEEERQREFRSLVINLKTELSKKEYAIQLLEKRCSDAEQAIIHYMKNSPDSLELLKQIRAEIPANIGITNIVEQNMQLTNKVNQLKGELNKFQQTGFLTTRKMAPGSLSQMTIRKDAIEMETKSKEKDKLLNNRIKELERQNKELEDQNKKLKSLADDLQENYDCLMRNYKNNNSKKVYDLDDKNLSKISKICVNSNPVMDSDDSQDLPELFNINELK